MLVEFGPEIWTAEGPVVTGAAGFRYPTRMTVMRLPGGTLVVWSPVALSPELRSQTEALGKIGFILPPNSLHHSFVAEWQQAYPEAAVLAPPGLTNKRADIRFAGNITDPLPEPWQGEIEVVVCWGNTITEEAVFFHRRSGTILFADLIQHLPNDWFGGWRGIVARLDLMTGAEAAVPRKFRMAFRDRQAARDAVVRILRWPSRAILIAHGAPVVGDTQGFLRQAFGWLLGK